MTRRQRRMLAIATLLVAETNAFQASPPGVVVHRHPTRRVRRAVGPTTSISGVAAIEDFDSVDDNRTAASTAANRPTDTASWAAGAETAVSPATLRFNNRLSRMAKSFDATTAPKVEALLLEAVRDYRSRISERENTGKQLVVPNTVSFTNAITAWARCTRKDSAKRSQALLDQMHALYEEEGWEHVRPNKISYNSAITAWARSGERGSARRAEKLLWRMYDFYDEEKGNTWGRGGRGDTGKVKDLLKPDARSWNAVINAVARSRDEACADRAKFLLDEMGRRYNDGDSDLLPDALTFGAIINAYANSLEEGASDKAAQLLMHMESLYQLGFENAKPTTFVYNACMNAFAKDPLTSEGDVGSNRAEQAERLLSSMERRYEKEGDYRVMPDCISYSTVINAYANSNTPRAGARADSLLRRMTARFLLGDTKCRPNAIAYTAAIKAHLAAIEAISKPSSSPAGDEKETHQMEFSAGRCEDLLQQLCMLCWSHGGDRSMRPTVVTFDLVDKALERIEDHEGLDRVKLLRDEWISQK